jgi:hypothetical protein
VCVKKEEREIKGRKVKKKIHSNQGKGKKKKERIMKREMKLKKKWRRRGGVVYSAWEWKMRKAVVCGNGGGEEK